MITDYANTFNKIWIAASGGYTGCAGGGDGGVLDYRAMLFCLVGLVRLAAGAGIVYRAGLGTVIFPRPVSGYSQFTDDTFVAGGWDDYRY